VRLPARIPSLIATTAFLFVAGCSAQSAKLSASLPGRSDAPSTSELEASMRAREQAVSTFRGQARLRYEGPDGRFKSSQMIVVEAPDRVRIDFMSPFGPTYTVAADGELLLAYDRGEKVLYRGRSSVHNVAQYTRVPVSIEVLASLIRGLPPLIARSDAGRVTESNGGWRWSADLSGGGGLAIDFDASATRPQAAVVEDRSGAEVMRVEFADYVDVDGTAVAHLISATLPSGEQVELKYSRIWRSIGFTEGAFQIDAPSGVRVVEMNEEAKAGGVEGDNSERGSNSQSARAHAPVRQAVR
jgi:outer membrane lipoprotein-sorting protein